jgi:hypothetical protein
VPLPVRRRNRVGRRRQVLFVVIVAMIASAVIVAATRRGDAVVAQLASDAVFVCYLGLLVRRRPARASVAPRRHRGSVPAARPMHPAAAGPASPAAPWATDAYGYDDVPLRQAVGS